MSGAARAALRRVLQHHKVTVHGDGVLEADIEAALGVAEEAQPVGEVMRTHVRPGVEGHWCKEVLLYSPGNPGDGPANRVKLYTAGRLSDALDWAERGLSEWRMVATSSQTEARRLAAENRIAVGHLQAVLNKCHTADEQQNADTAARDWLISIGSEPT